MSNKKNEIWIGTVQEVDEKTGMVTVVYSSRENMVSKSLPMLHFNNEYKLPVIGSNVVVICTAEGDEIVLGGFWGKKTVPTETGTDLYQKKLGENAVIQYREGTKELHIKADKIVLEAAERITEKASHIVLESDKNQQEW